MLYRTEGEEEWEKARGRVRDETRSRITDRAGETTIKRERANKQILYFVGVNGNKINKLVNECDIVSTNFVYTAYPYGTAIGIEEKMLFLFHKFD